MRKLTILLFVIIFSIIPSIGMSQTVSQFSYEREKYLDELGDFFNQGSADQKKKGKAFVNEFADFLLDEMGGVSEAQMKRVTNTSNKMLKKRYKPFPEFEIYLRTIIAINSDKEWSEDDSYNWNAIVDTIMTVEKYKKRDFDSYLDFSLNFFKSHALHLTHSVNWYTPNTNFAFEFDKDPYIEFYGGGDLIGVSSKKDSIIIFGTIGTYYPIENIWIGKGGKIGWQRAGYTIDKVFAELNNYSINTQFVKFEADSVYFTNINYFSTPLMGNIEEKAMPKILDPVRVTYPKFYTYSDVFRIENIFENIDYEGGFSQIGAKVKGTGSDLAKACLIIKKDGQEFMKVFSDSYAIRPTGIRSTSAAVSIYWENDSIYHPDLEFTFVEGEKQLVKLSRRKDLIGQTPFINSFHDINMYVNEIEWVLGSPTINFKMAHAFATSETAVFESQNHYAEWVYDKIQRIDDENPLRLLRRYARSINSNVVFIPDYAAYTRKPLSGLQAQLLEVASYGFISYNSDDTTVTILDRLDFYLNARDEITDYDVIKFSSVVTSDKVNNASLSLLNFDLDLNGVSRVFLSDSQQVVVFPLNQQIVLKENRDFQFSGKIQAGMFDYFAKECYFSYDKFNIDMPKIDSMAIFVEDHTKPINVYGQYPLVRVTSTVQDLIGDIVIDMPNNKSGLSMLSEYPIFHSKQESFVYYQKRSIHNNAYKEKEFYYEISPFTVDSLDNFSTDGLEFAGQFVSAGIFPVIYQPLRIMPDYSLGFTHQTNAGGLDAYGGKGKFEQTIDLSNQGLKGHGEIHYLTSTGVSDDIDFLPNRTIAEFQEFKTRPQTLGVEFPFVSGRDIKCDWAPYQDIMLLDITDKMFNMYSDSVYMKGQLKLQPDLLSGNGTMIFDNAEMDSRLFKYLNMSYSSDTTNFRLKSHDLSEYSFVTTNYKSEVDFKERKGTFRSNDGTSISYFPDNLYICYMDGFKWNMDDAIIEINSETNGVDYSNMSEEEMINIELTGAQFYSIQSTKDSLHFVSPNALYNLDTKLIIAEGVQYINVADASIFPIDGKVYVEERAVMRPLDSAVIIAHVSEFSHKFYNCHLNISGANMYKGFGYFDYLDETNSKQSIYFAEITVDSAVQTIANGEIEEAENFTLSPYFEYKGDIQLSAAKEFINYKGGARIKDDCEPRNAQWIKFQADIDPKNIYIPIGDEIKNVENGLISAGIFYASDSAGIYSAFFQRKNRRKDLDVAISSGFLTYYHVTDEYRIASKEKLAQPELPGNFIARSIEECSTYGEGKIDMGNNMGQVTTTTFGNATYYSMEDSLHMQLMILLDFWYNKDAIKMLQTNFSEATQLPSINTSDEHITKGLAEILGINEADDFISRLNLGNFKKLPDSLNSTLFIADVNMIWDPVTETYISDGDIGIGAIDGSMVFRYVKGIIQIEKRRSGDMISFYLELNSSEYYYFQYRANSMLAFSSVNAFNDIIRKLESQDKIMKVQSGERPYSYGLTSERRVRSFLKQFEEEEDEDDYDDYE